MFKEVLLVAKRDEKVIKVTFRLNEIDMGMLEFCAKMLKKSKSEVLRKAIKMLKQDLVTGRYDDEIS